MTAILTRRRVLQMLGAGAALVPFVPMLSASAESGTPPKRIIFLFTSCGTVYPAWKPTGTASDFTLGPILQPLAPFKDRLLVLDGLSYATGGAGTRHFQGPHRFLAGSRLLEGGSFEAVNGSTSGWGSHISVDQHIAKKVGNDTPFASLEFGVNIDVTDPRSRMSFSASNKPVAPEDNPYKMFDRIFADAGLSAEELARLRARRQSVIDTVRAQIDVIAQKSAGEDRDKLEAHLEGLRSIEKRLQMGAGTCEPPAVGNPIDHHATANFPTVSRLQLDIMAAALGCDLTRVCSLMWSRETSPQSFPWLGFNDKHHLLSHAGDSNTAAQSKLVEINQYYAGEMAYLMQKLDELPESDGTTVLDNTLIVWGNGLGKGNIHSQTRIPHVLGGGAQGYFEMGRSLTYDNRLNNRLLVSLCRYMGITDQQTFGNLDAGSGPLGKLIG